VLITGYEDHPLVDGTDLLAEPAFWETYLGVGLGEDGGADIDDVEELLDELMDHDHWPVFTVPLHHGAAIWVIHRNLDGDMGLDFVLSHPGWPEDLRLASIEGSFVGPGLSWPELTAIADNPPPDSHDGVVDPADRLLMLLPAVGDTDLPADAVEVLAAALIRNTAVTEPTRGAIALLHPHPRGFFEPATWQRLDNGALICNGRYSPRSVGHFFSFRLDQAIAVTHALTAR
jgi:hypothetical protein